MNMNIVKLLVVPGLLFLVLTGFGYLVSKGGKPYNNLLFNIHKLIALGAVILTGIRIFRLDPFNTFSNLALLLIALAGLGVISMFATGAVMSIKDEVPRAALMVHRVFPAAILFAFLGAVYLIINIQLVTL